MTSMTENISQKDRTVLILLVSITVLAFALRFWQLKSVPPGWRDDELINSLVISQKIVDGDLSVYYADASGHEALYHALNGIMLAIFGPGVPGIRWLSALLGAITVPFTYLVGRRLFGSLTGIIAAAALAVSFWSLMYSRIGIRHILTPVLALATFYFFLPKETLIVALPLSSLLKAPIIRANISKAFSLLDISNRSKPSKSKNS